MRGQHGVWFYVYRSFVAHASVQIRGYFRATVNDTISNIVYNPEVVFILSTPWHSQPLLCEQCMFYGSISTWLCLLDSGIRKGHCS